MGKVALVADTTGYLPTALAEQHQISLVSLWVNFGGDRTEREAGISDYGEFFDELRSGDRLPTTSQPSVGDFIEAYEPLLAEGRDIVSVHLSGAVSGTVESAHQAAEALARDGRGGERITVVDSHSAAGGMGLLVLVAARRIAAGDTPAEVAAAVGRAREDLKMWFAVDTLEFLRRGGRIGAASAWIGSTLKVKPILTLEDELIPVERVRTSKRAFERLVDYARRQHEDGSGAWVVQHVCARDDAEALAERCREIFGNEPEFVSEIGAVLSTHAGPGLLGVGTLPASHLD